MALPGYAAEASLSPASRSYCRGRNWLAGNTSPTVIAQQSPCDIVAPPPPPWGAPCGFGQKCCEWDNDLKRCTMCVARGRLCP
jgi:hypothetical protein